MMNRLILALARGAVIPAVLLAASVALAQNYPARPITVVAPFPPGASVDAMARITRDSLSEILGQPIVIENRTGAAGTAGANSVATAAPDGYTLLITVNAPITMNSFMQKSYPFDPKTAFAPVTLAAETSLLLAVHPSVPANNVAELVAYAKGSTAKLSYGSAGVGSGHHITGELLKQKTGIDMNHVPYRGGGPAIQDLVAGHIQISFGTPPSVLPQAAAGRIRILATSEDKRFPDLPDVPTIAETVPGVAIPITWLGLLAPAGTPKPIVDKLNAAMLATLKKPDVIAKLKQQGLMTTGEGPDALDQKIKSELAFFGQTIPALGIQAE
jgi:tripartite-type tricarboxylate transporter receptor subunit TctC